MVAATADASPVWTTPHPASSGLWWRGGGERASEREGGWRPRRGDESKSEALLLCP